MKLTLERISHAAEYTIGKLFVDGEQECFTLEDAVREIPTRPVAEWKVQDRTAIPRGLYRVAITYSNRFRKPLPLIEGVPGFSGVRIHPGNHSGNTEGCILVGESWTGGDWIGSSRAAFEPLFAKMKAASDNGEAISIEVK